MAPRLDWDWGCKMAKRKHGVEMSSDLQVMDLLDIPQCTCDSKSAKSGKTSLPTPKSRHAVLKSSWLLHVVYSTSIVALGFDNSKWDCSLTV